LPSCDGEGSVVKVIRPPPFRHAVPHVVLDTNALLMPFQFPVNLEAELRRLMGDCEVVVPRVVLDELRGLAREDRAARAALRLAARYAVAETEATGDAAIVEAAQRLQAAVVTNDTALLAELRRRRIPRIRLRSRTHLVLEEDP
jgi:rRNA-processing protein FCF1